MSNFNKDLRLKGYILSNAVKRFVSLYKTIDAVSFSPGPFNIQSPFKKILLIVSCLIASHC